MRSFIVLFSLSLTLSLAHSANLTGGTREEAKMAIRSSIRARARANRLKDGPVAYTRHFESDYETCSSICLSKAGDALCDAECYTPGCTYDGGDCPMRPYRPCHELVCSNNGRCDSDCLLAGCPTNCDMGEYHHEYLHFFSPYLSPMAIFSDFPEMEERIEKETGLVLKMAMLYGIADGKREPYAHLWPLFPIRNTYNESIAYFRVQEGFFAPNDTKTLHALERMGSPFFVSQVSPLILGEKQINHFAVFARSFDEEREERQKEKTMMKKEKKEKKGKKEMKVFRIDY